MDSMFRLIKATFFLVLAVLLLVLANVFGQGSMFIATVGIVGALLLSLIGIAGGYFAIIDYNKEQEEHTEE